MAADGWLIVPPDYAHVALGNYVSQMNQKPAQRALIGKETIK
jgi:hypothetical protein